MNYRGPLTDFNKLLMGRNQLYSGFRLSLAALKRQPKPEKQNPLLRKANEKSTGVFDEMGKLFFVGYPSKARILY